MKTLKMKRLGSLLLALVMALSLLPVNALADVTVVEEDATYQLLSDGTLIVLSTKFRKTAFNRKDEVKIVRLTSGVDEGTNGLTPLDNVFNSGYPALTAFEQGGSLLYSVRDGVLFNAAGTKLFCYPAAKPGSAYMIPDGVEFIIQNAFAGVVSMPRLYASQTTIDKLKESGESGLSGLSADITACETPVEALTLDQNALSLDTSERNKTATLTATVAPNDATVRDVLWSSSNESVAAVDQNGVVTAVGSGNATITAQSLGLDAGGEFVTDTCTVTVEVPVTEMVIAGEESEVDNVAVAVDAEPEPGDPSAVLSVQIDEAATNREVIWTSSNENVALLSANEPALGAASGMNGGAAVARLLLADGAPAKTVAVTAGADGLAAVTVVPRGSGTVTVTATAGDQSKTFTLTLSKWINIGGVTLDSTELALNINETAALAATLVPTDVDDPALVWSSSDGDVATVDQTGEVTAVGPGDATITLSVTTGTRTETASCAVNVAIPVSGVTLDRHDMTLELSGTESGNVFGQLVATVDPGDATNKALVWSSSDGSVATVDQTGKVTAIAKGEATVTVRSSDATTGEHKDTCTVTVKALATGIALDRYALSLEKNETDTLTATVTPDVASDKTVAWSVTDQTPAAGSGDVVTVDQNGTITAKGLGVATVAAATTDGSDLSVSCRVTVSAITPKSFLQSPENKTVLVDGTVELTAQLGPEDAANRALRWESGDASVATVSGVTLDENGVSHVTVTGVKAGRVTITATSEAKPSLSATCTVTVPPVPVSGLTISEPTLKLRLDANYPAAGARQLSVTIDPAKATSKDIVWTVSDAGADVVSVAADPNDSTKATVTALKAGRATVIASSAHGDNTTVTTSCEVTVEQAAASVALQNPSLDLKLSPANQTTGTLTALITPADATDAITWTSSVPAVARVGAPENATAAEGRTSTVTVTAVGGGTTTITVTCNGKSDSCELTVPHLVSGVTLDKTELTLAKDAAATLTPTVGPEDAEDKSVTWSTSDSAVATVSNGVVTAVNGGTAIITATTTDGGFTAKCTVTVTVAAESITLDRETLTLRLGTQTAADTATLTATVAPANTTAPVLWSVNSDAVTLSENETTIHKTTGRTSVNLTAVHAAEDVRITATVGGKTATCVLTVQQAGGTLSVAPASLDLSLTGTDEEKSGALTATLTPKDATDAIVWETSNPDVATVSAPADGATENARTSAVTVTAVGGGTARITARCGSLVSEPVPVTVPMPVAGVSLNKYTLSLEKGETELLTAAIAPENAANKNLIWESSDTTVATVTSSGLVSALKTGSATITVTAPGGKNVSASCELTVTEISVKEFLTAPNNLTVREKESGSVSAKLGPAGAAGREIEWSIGSDAIATLGAVTYDAETGVSTVAVTGVKAGAVTITATSVSNPAVSQTAVVTVNPIHVNSVSLSEPTLRLEQGQSTTLRATLDPTDASDQDVTWIAAPAGVVEVTPTNDTATAGVSTVSVRALAEGTASVVVTTADGSKQAACVVTVPVKVKALALNKTALTLGPNQSETLIPSFTPNDAENCALRWFSSDTSVATVDENGVVSANPDIVFAANEAPRVAVISAQTTDGSNLTKQCTVTVQRTAVTHVTLDCSTLALDMKNTTSGTLTATVKPDGATVGTVAWSVSDDTVVSVTPNGLAATIAARRPGSAVVTVTSTDGSYTADCAVTVAPTAVTGVALTPTTLNLAVDGTGALTAEITPHDATNRAVSWRSSDESVATVSAAQTTADAESGTTSITVSARKAGSATIYATTQDGALTASCTVLIPETPVTSVALDEHEWTLNLDIGAANAEKTLTATVSPSNATHKGVTWLSSDDTVATVDQNGKVTAAASGTATITALSVDGVHKAECVVTVKWNVTGVELAKHATTVVKGGTEQLAAEIKPDAVNHTLTWTSSNEAVAAVSGSGLVSALKPGNATIRATVTGGTNYDECVVTVTSPASGIALNKNVLDTLAIGENQTLSATVTPSDSTDAVTWSSSDEAVATVAAGVVTAVGGGRAEITASCGGFSAKCVVTIPTPVTGVSLNKNELSLGIGGTEPLAAVVEPLGATNRGVTWESDDNDVATVDANGVVTGVAVGTANVTVTTADGGKTATCAVTVVPTAATGVAVSGSALAEDGSLTLNMTDHTTAALSATVSPDDATDKSVRWTSADGTVVSIGAPSVENGVSTVTLTAQKPGSTVVTVTTVSGGHKATCLVTVSTTAVTNVTLTGPETLSVTGTEEQKTGTLTAAITPGAATNQTLYWSVDNADVLELNKYQTTGEGGSSAVTVTAKKAGTATVTVTTQDGGKSATHTINIPATPVTGLSIPESLTLTLNNPVDSAAASTLTVTVTPANATDKNVTWQSGDPDTVTVTKLNDTTATVTAKKAGAADVTVTCADGVTAVCHVTVVQTSSGVTITSEAPALSLVDPEKHTATLTASVTPADVSGDVVWTSSNESVVSVGASETVSGVGSKTGSVVVTAVGGGTARITASCGGKSAYIDVTIAPHVASISLSETSLTLAQGGEKTLTATVLPAEAEDRTVTWSSSNGSVATVDANGKITAVGGGSATVTATTRDGGKTASCDVTVTVGLTGLTLDSTSLTLKLGTLPSAASATLTATVTPADTTAGPVRWASSNTSIVTVGAGETAVDKTSGKASVTLAAVAPGSTTVTATIGTSSMVCTVTVEQAATSFSIPDALALTLNSTPEAASQKLTPTIAPAGVTDAVTWSSDNTGVAAVNESGVVTAVSVGSATITARCGEKSDTCTVTVTALASGVSVTPEAVALEVGERTTPAASALPANASNPALTWTSANTGIATVNASTGEITAAAVGSTTVTAATSNGKSKTITVTVSAVKPKAFLTRPGDLSIDVGDTGELTASVTAEAEERGITWTSSDPTVVSVEGVAFEGGVSTVTLEAHKAGRVTITATAVGNHELTAQCTVAVPSVPVTGVSLDKTSLELKYRTPLTADGSANLTAELSNDSGRTPSNTGVNWSSLNTEVATVSAGANGTAVVTAAGPGTTTILATPADGGNASAACVVTVTVPTTGVSLNLTAGTLTLGSRAVETLTARVLPYPDADQTVDWEITAQTPNDGSSDVISLSASGAAATVTALHPGTATVRVSAPDTGFHAEYIATVTRSATGLTLDESALALSMTDPAKRNATLSATVAPSDTTDALTWSSSDNTVASVTDNGDGTATVTAQKGGSATITAACGAYSKTCAVTVPVPVSSVSLDKTELTLEVGKGAALNATILPSTAADKRLTWTSGSDAVATVNESGAVTAVAAGTTTITVTAQDGSGQSASCAVTVVPVAVTGVTLDRSALSMEAGDTETLNATVAPDDAANKAVTWDTSDAGVATVENGVVTATGVGTATVTAATADGGKTASCAVTVWATDAERVELDKDSLPLDLNGVASGTLTATVKPDNVTEKGVLWSVSAPGVVTLSVGETQSGSPVTITAAGAGTVTITVAAKHDGTVKTSCTVTVPVPVTGIALSASTGASPSAITLDPGDVIELHATASPALAENRAVSAAVPDGAPVTAADISTSYGGDGAHLRVTGKQPASGNAETFTVTATAEDGGFSDTFRITVRPAVTSVGLNKTALDVTPGAGAALTATVLPAAANQTLTWTSSDESVATVDQSGSVRAVADGTATITAAAKNGVSASCDVTVQTHVTGVEIRSGGAQTSSLTLNAVEAAGTHSATLTAAVLPAGASNQNVSWTVDDPDVLTISASGSTAVVTGVKAGAAIVTLTSAESGASAQCAVTVERATVAFGKTSLVLRFTGSAETQSVALSPVDAGFAIGAPVVNGTASAASCNTSVYDSIGFTGDADGLVTYTFSRGADDKYTAVNQTVSVLSLHDVFTGVSLEGMDARDNVSAALNGTGDVRSIVLTGYTAAKPNTVNWAQRVVPAFADALQGSVAGGRITLRRVNENGVNYIDVLVDGAQCYRYQIDFNGVKWTQDVTDTSFTASVDIFAANGDAGSASSGTVDVPEGFVDYVLMAGETPAANEELEAEITLNIRPGSNTDAANALSLDVTPSYVINHYATDGEGNRLSETPTGTEDKGALSDLGGYQATITVVLDFEPQLIQHIHRDGAGNVLSVEYPAFRKVNNGDGTWTVTWRQSTFSEVNIFAATHSGYVRFAYGAGAADDVERFDERSVGAALPVPAAVSGKTFAGWSVNGVTAKTVTNALLAAIDGNSSRTPVTATPVWSDEAPGEDTPVTPVRPVTPSRPSASDDSRDTTAPAKPQEPEKPTTPSFTDVSAEHWAAEAIGYVAAHGIFNGVGGGKFAPELAMSRAMIAQMLCNFDGAENAGASPFADTAGTWYDAAAGWTAANGVAVGDGGRFNGDAPVTREQMAVMLYRYAKAKGLDVSARAELTGFADAGAVSEWAREAMSWAVAAGLIRGTLVGLEPGSGATRAQVATIMMRYCQNCAERP